MQHAFITAPKRSSASVRHTASATRAPHRPVSELSGSVPSRPTRTHGQPVDRYRRVHRPTPSAQVYLRRRVGAVLAVCGVVTLAVAGVGVAVGGFGGSPAYAAESPTVGADVPARAAISTPANVHVAQAGESLWSIADQHRGGEGRESYLDALIDLNGSTSVQIGQAVILP